MSSPSDNNNNNSIYNINDNNNTQNTRVVTSSNTNTESTTTRNTSSEGTITPSVSPIDRLAPATTERNPNDNSTASAAGLDEVDTQPPFPVAKRPLERRRMLDDFRKEPGSGLWYQEAQREERYAARREKEARDKLEAELGYDLSPDYDADSESE